jgi:hypothetical protein
VEMNGLYSTDTLTGDDTVSAGVLLLATASLRGFHSFPFSF